jgi:hypothetical protein
VPVPRKNHEEQTANVLIIAAAPDLLAALRLALPWLENRSNDEMVAVARAALAKAEGKAP